MEPKQNISPPKGLEGVYFRESTPDNSFLTQMYSFVKFEYSKQLPKNGNSYFDRLHSIPGLILPTVRPYRKSTGAIEINLASSNGNGGLDVILLTNEGNGRTYGPFLTGYSGIATGSHTYSGNPVSRGYSSSDNLGYSPANSVYQS